MYLGQQSSAGVLLSPSTSGQNPTGSPSIPVSPRYQSQDVYSQLMQGGGVPQHQGQQQQWGQQQQQPLGELQQHLQQQLQQLQQLQRQQMQQLQQQDTGAGPSVGPGAGQPPGRDQGARDMLLMQLLRLHGPGSGSRQQQHQQQQQEEHQQQEQEERKLGRGSSKVRRNSNMSIRQQDTSLRHHQKPQQQHRQQSQHQDQRRNHRQQQQQVGDLWGGGGQSPSPELSHQQQEQQQLHILMGDVQDVDFEPRVLNREQPASVQAMDVTGSLGVTGSAEQPALINPIWSAPGGDHVNLTSSGLGLVAGRRAPYSMRSCAAMLQRSASITRVTAAVAQAAAAGGGAGEEAVGDVVNSSGGFAELDEQEQEMLEALMQVPLQSPLELPLQLPVSQPGSPSCVSAAVSSPLESQQQLLQQQQASGQLSMQMSLPASSPAAGSGDIGGGGGGHIGGLPTVASITSAMVAPASAAGGGAGAGSGGGGGVSAVPAWDILRSEGKLGSWADEADQKLRSGAANAEDVEGDVEAFLADYGMDWEAEDAGGPPLELTPSFVKAAATSIAAQAQLAGTDAAAAGAGDGAAGAAGASTVGGGGGGEGVLPTGMAADPAVQQQAADGGLGGQVAGSMGVAGLGPVPSSDHASDLQTLDPVTSVGGNQSQLSLQGAVGMGRGPRGSFEGAQDGLIAVQMSPAGQGAVRDPRKSFESAPAALFVPIVSGSATLGPGPNPPDSFSQPLSVMQGRQGLGRGLHASAGDLLVMQQQHQHQNLNDEQGFLNSWHQQPRAGLGTVGATPGDAGVTTGVSLPAPGAASSGDAGSSGTLDQSLVGMLSSCSNESHPLAALTKVEMLQQQMERIQQQLSEMRAQALHRHISSKSSIGQ